MAISDYSQVNWAFYNFFLSFSKGAMIKLEIQLEFTTLYTHLGNRITIGWEKCFVRLLASSAESNAILIN